MTRRGCSCIRSGGDGRIVLQFSDGAIPWKCPDADKCRHLQRMQENDDMWEKIGNGIERDIEKLGGV